MIIIWRAWGWLVLPFFLFAWFLADNVTPAIYRGITGLETLFNPDDAICWAIALFLIAIPLGALAFWRKHAERTRTPQEQAVEDEKRRVELAKYEQTRIATGLAPDLQLQTIINGQAPLPPVTRVKSSFFFIPFWIMPFVFVAIGMLLLVVNVPVAAEQIRG